MIGMLPRVSWKMQREFSASFASFCSDHISRFAGLFVMFHYCCEILMCPIILAFYSTVFS